MRARGFLTQVKTLIDGRVEQGIASLHDVKTAVNLVNRNAEVLVESYPGDTFNEKVRACEDPLRNLLTSVDILNTRFTVSSIVANPDSAKMGRPRRISVYKLFDKMHWLFREIALKKHVHIEIGGRSKLEPQAYDSFETIPLVLIDNAVKYSVPGQQITITINDESDGVYVSVDSIGITINDDDIERIFEKGFRTKEAERVAANGSGLGLYTAYVVLDAHDSKLWYKASGVGSDGKGKNTFSFKIPLCPRDGSL